jgi:hypothetical protein
MTVFGEFLSAFFYGRLAPALGARNRSGVPLVRRCRRLCSTAIKQRSDGIGDIRNTEDL